MVFILVGDVWLVMREKVAGLLGHKQGYSWHAEGRKEYSSRCSGLSSNKELHLCPELLQNGA